MAVAKACGRSDAQMPAGLDAASADTGLGIGYIGQHALAVFQKRTALVREADAPRGAHHELDAQALFQRVQAAANDGCRNAFGLRSRG